MFSFFYGLEPQLRQIEKLIDTLTLIRFDKHVQTIQSLKCSSFITKSSKKSFLKCLNGSQCPNNLFNWILIQESLFDGFFISFLFDVQRRVILWRDFWCKPASVDEFQVTLIGFPRELKQKKLWVFGMELSLKLQAVPAEVRILQKLWCW